jgi:predicted regulator of Ras-like GTPase activity (Roadblock/LC7/MglB family)
MSDAFTTALERISRIPGVLGALVIEADAAVPVVAELSEGVNGTAVAALAASLFRRSSLASEAAQFGRLVQVQLEAEYGHVVIVGAGDLILAVVAEHDAQLGLLRLEAASAARSLA